MSTSKIRPRLAAAVLMAALLLCLPACKPDSTKRPPPSDPPLPPRVDCEQPWASGPDNPPGTWDPVTWSAWAAKTLGDWRIDRINRGAERQCVRDLKQAGVIR